MPRAASLPFTLRRSQEVITAGSVTTTTENIHGLLRLEGDHVTIQWRLSRQTDLVGREIRTDHKYDAVRTVTIPLRGIAGAHVRRRWWKWWASAEVVLTAADLEAFEAITGEEGLRSAHPAELVLRLRPSDALLADEFAAELSLALAERALAAAETQRAIGDGSTS